jgi:hypothetical protein
MPFQPHAAGESSRLAFKPMIRWVWAAALFAFTFECPREVIAASEPKKASFDIPSSQAAPALKKYSAQSGQQVLYSNRDLAGVITNEVRGKFTAEDALRRLLAGTPLVASRDTRSGAVAVGRESSDPNGRRTSPKSAGVRPTI